MLRKDQTFPGLRGIERLVASITKAIRSEKICQNFRCRNAFLFVILSVRFQKNN